VSIPHLRLNTEERVVGFEVLIKSGRVTSIPNTPIGWYLTIDNDASWNTSVKANVSVGAASLDARFFRKFVVVEKNESLGSPFSIQCDVIVTKDFQAQRHIQIGIGELVLKRIPAPKPVPTH
jgi:hypothetical protein